ncbi:ead/Ea22-like family protein [Salmonella enterica subsp. enterica]|nr:ead/Ea22-like family protein [Salmonella enterica subsp. enterica serovar Cairina]ECD3750446.1 ead/Ea22-like family protein [Salmonella enterica subsp. enterica serovar Cairina]EDU0171523.1 ead/Ea22-like family protein [Salmonella enterica subsp. enterica serovar Belfast]EDX9681747.1 ead/Ea22-like family protein [Salmonella enterica subsp. enterica serovar Belfast]EDY5457076.1 ead/Ea22-like family protein [Salmonella enterica subsp. enterica serovar Belfast]
MNIDKRALREVAEKATKGPWKVFSDIDTKTFSIHTPRDKRCENVIKWGGFDCQPNAEANAEFIAAFNPKVALALLDENIQLQRGKDALEAVALALRDDMRDARGKLEAAERLIAELDQRLIEYAGIATREARRVAELEARTVTVKLYDDFQLCHYGTTEDYAKGYIDSQNNFTKWLSAAGIKVKES